MSREERAMTIQHCIEEEDVLIWDIENRLEDKISPHRLSQIKVVRNRIQFLRDLNQYVDYLITYAQTDFRVFKLWMEQYPEINTLIPYHSISNFHDFKFDLVNIIKTLDEIWLESLGTQQTMVAEAFREIENIEQRRKVLRSLRRAI